MTHPIPAAALEHHIGVLGKTGAGKSFAAQGVAEHLIAKRQRVCIIDPTDRYWGLRLMPDGKTPSGLDAVIFGGAHADLPLGASHGAALAEIVGTTTTPAIISTRLLTVGERTRFFTDFAEALLRKNDGPLHLIIDEAHLFAPQAGARTGGDAPKLLHATNNLVSLGRGIGLRIMLLSQRAAKLHKDSLTQVETLVAMRLIAPHDVGAVKAWIEDWADPETGKDVVGSLPSLPTGTAWLWAPELEVLRKVTFPMIGTYDSGKPLAAGKKGPTLAPIDLDAVRGKLETVARDAVENDPARLKAKIRELEKALKAKPAAPVDEERLRRTREEGRQAGLREGAAAIKERERLIREREHAIQKALGFLAPFAREQGGIHIIDLPPPKPTIDVQPLPTKREFVRDAVERSVAVKGNGAARATRSESSGEGLPKGERACLVAIAQHDEGVTRSQLTILTGYKRSTRDAYVQRLRERGHVELAGDRVHATEGGIAALGSDYEPLPTGEALRRHWLERLPEGERRVLEAVLAAWPDAADRDAITDATGYKRSTRDAYLQRLAARELVTAERGAARAAEKLMEDL